MKSAPRRRSRTTTNRSPRSAGAAAGRQPRVPRAKKPARRATKSSRGAWGAPDPGQTPARYLAAIADESRRADMESLHRLVRKTVPGLAPYMSTGMIGYGTYHYRYASGREGDCSIIGLSSRAQYISLYVLGVKDGQYVAESYRSRLPKADIGKSCVRFKRLADVDRAILAKMIAEGARATARNERAMAKAGRERSRS